MAVKRCCYKRGRPSIMNSDSSGEYIRGRNTIQEVFRLLNMERTHQKLQNDVNMTCYLAPLKVPRHWVIEKIVKAIKNPLSKCLIDKRLIETELYTVLSRWSLSKQRPSSSTSENPNDKTSRDLLRLILCPDEL